MRRKNKGGPRGRGPSGQTGRQVETVECPNCGCPNVPTAQRCMFCREEIERRNPTLGEIFAYYLYPVKIRFAAAGMRLGLVNYRFAAKAALYSLITVVLSVFGVKFVLIGVESGGFFNWAVGLLCLAYAAALVKNLYSAIRGS